MVFITILITFVFFILVSIEQINIFAFSIFVLVYENNAAGI